MKTDCIAIQLSATERRSQRILIKPITRWVNINPYKEHVITWRVMDWHDLLMENVARLVDGCITSVSCEPATSDGIVQSKTVGIGSQLVTRMLITGEWFVQIWFRLLMNQTTQYIYSVNWLEDLIDVSLKLISIYKRMSCIKNRHGRSSG